MSESRYAHLNPTKDENGSWVVAEYEGWKTGQKIRALEDDEDEGIYAGDEGTLLIEVVGSPEYGNERIAFSIKTEQMDAAEVARANFEAAEDAQQ